MTEVINRFIYIDPIGTMDIMDKENDIFLVHIDLLTEGVVG